MSTISISATGRPARVARAESAARVTAVSAPASTRLRMTERGRRVLVALAALPLIVGIAFAFMSGGSAVASSDTVSTPVTFETVKVAEGDTLWSIAQDVAPDADPRDVIDDILAFNVLSTSAITPGQTLSIPAEYTD